MCTPIRAPGPLGLAAGLALSILAGCGGGQVPFPEPPAVAETAGLVLRGEYIVRNAAVCGHCHAADPDFDPDGPLIGGFENWRFGTIRAPNITPDSATGLGTWSVEEIIRPIRTRQGRDGDLLVPVMPYRWFHGMSDEDARAVAL